MFGNGTKKDEEFWGYVYNQLCKDNGLPPNKNPNDLEQKIHRLFWANKHGKCSRKEADNEYKAYIAEKRREWEAEKGPRVTRRGALKIAGIAGIAGIALALSEKNTREESEVYNDNTSLPQIEETNLTAEYIMNHPEVLEELGFSEGLAGNFSTYILGIKPTSMDKAIWVDDLVNQIIKEKVTMEARKAWGKDMGVDELFFEYEPKVINTMLVGELTVTQEGKATIDENNNVVYPEYRSFTVNSEYNDGAKYAVDAIVGLTKWNGEHSEMSYESEFGDGVQGEDTEREDRIIDGYDEVLLSALNFAIGKYRGEFDMGNRVFKLSNERQRGRFVKNGITNEPPQTR